MPPISTAQMRMIYALSRKAAMDNDTLHALIAARTGMDSVRALTVQQANTVIDRLRLLCGDQPQEPPDRATRAQQGKIARLTRDMGWEDKSRLRAFLSARFGVSDAKFLTAAKAWACIEALKAMQAGGRGERRRV